MFFTEQNADSIGVLARLADGKTHQRERTSTAAACSRLASRSTRAATSGSREGSSNRLGRMTLDPDRAVLGRSHARALQRPQRRSARPCPAAAERRPGVRAPTGPLPPLVLPNPALTTLPHSVAVDRKGRVWYTGEASERVGYLDPAKASPSTTEGFHGRARPVERVRPRARAGGPRDRPGRHGLHRRRVRRPDREGDDRRRRADPRAVRLPPDRAQQPHRLAAGRPAGQPLVQRGGREPDHTHLGRRGEGRPRSPRRPARRRRRRSCPSRRPPRPRAGPASRQAQPQPACTITRWLSRTGSGRGARRTLPLLGLTAAKAQRCLGKPARTARTAKVETWTYPAVELRFSKGAVDAFTAAPRRACGSDPDRAASARRSRASARRSARSRRDGRGYRGLVAVTRRTSPTCGSPWGRPAT